MTATVKQSHSPIHVSNDSNDSSNNNSVHDFLLELIKSKLESQHSSLLCCELSITIVPDPARSVDAYHSHTIGDQFRTVKEGDHDVHYHEPSLPKAAAILRQKSIKAPAPPVRIRSPLESSAGNRKQLLSSNNPQRQNDAQTTTTTTTTSTFSSIIPSFNKVAVKLPASCRKPLPRQSKRSTSEPIPINARKTWDEPTESLDDLYHDCPLRRSRRLSHPPTAGSLVLSSRSHLCRWTDV